MSRVALDLLKVNSPPSRITVEELPRHAARMMALSATAADSGVVAERPMAWNPFDLQNAVHVQRIGITADHVRANEPIEFSPFDTGAGTGVIDTGGAARHGDDLLDSIARLEPEYRRPVRGLIGGGELVLLDGKVTSPNVLDSAFYWPTAIVNIDPVARYRHLRRGLDTARGETLKEIARRLDAAKGQYSAQAPASVVAYLTDDLGAGQLLTARALGVTPTAVRKWRRGEAARSEHRSHLSEFAAMCALLGDAGMHDPAGWLDIPISSQSTLKPLDLFTSGRSDLVVLLGSQLADPQETLDSFNPRWREEFPTDPDYEVVTLADGSRSAIPRRKGR